MPTWGELLTELEQLSVDDLRRKYLRMLSNKTERNVIAYYSGWLKPGRTHNIDINDSDLTGFMNVMKGLDSSKGLDVILHTPGGNPTATEGIVRYLHNKFGNDIRVIVPQLAMSAGTMLACSASKIIMGKHSSLGPIDPQYNGVPAYNIVEEFKDAKRDLDCNPQAKTYWELQLNRYPAAFFYTVIDSIQLAGTLVSEWLKSYMFAGEPIEVVNKKVEEIVGKLNANNKSHSRHFDFEFCRNLGLKVSALEEDKQLQDLVLSVHHAFVITFDKTAVTKIIENQFGACYVTANA